MFIIALTFWSKLPMAKNWLLGERATDLIPKAQSYALNVARHRPSTDHIALTFWSKLPMAKNWLLGDHATDLIPKA